jgi:FtsX-like permease family
MLVSVTERTREIGILMAVGARRVQILLQFLVESALLSIVGGLPGVALGIVASKILSALASWPTLISPIAVFGGFAFAAAVGLFFGWYPARKASRLDPIEAFRYEWPFASIKADPEVQESVYPLSSDCVAHGIQDIDEVARRRHATEQRDLRKHLHLVARYVVNTPQLLVLPEIIPTGVNLRLDVGTHQRECARIGEKKQLAAIESEHFGQTR